ncbi:MAG: amidase [Acidimicrobiales bacterium]
MRTEEYANLDACGLAELLAAGKLTPVEVAAAATDAHHRLHARRLGAIIEWYPDPNPDRGPNAGRDRDLPLGTVGALAGRWAGVPVLRKDYGATEAGRLVERGSRLSIGWRATSSSALFRRLGDLGVVVRGRTAVPEFILHATTESRLSGITINPWNPTRSAGGSSGGAAAAVAAGIVPVAHASDCAGSIRIPAAVCGLIGLKPTRGAVPWGESVGIGGWGGIAEEFVLTRTVRDARLALTALTHPAAASPPTAALARPTAALARPAATHRAAPTQHGLTSPTAVGPARSRAPAPTPAPARATDRSSQDTIRSNTESTSIRPYGPPEPYSPSSQAILGFRIGVVVDHWAGLATDPALQVAVEQAAHRLDAAGHPVTPTSWPVPYERLAALMDPLFGLSAAAEIHMIAAYTGRTLGHHTLEPLTLEYLESLRALPPDAHAHAITAAVALTARLDRWLEPFDAILCSTLGRADLPLGRLGGEVPLAQWVAANDEFTPHSFVANVTGWPALSVPWGLGPSGVPIGIQLLARRGGDHLLLDLADTLAQTAPPLGQPRLHASVLTPGSTQSIS